MVTKSFSEEMNSMSLSLTLLGTGSPTPLLDRAGPSTLVALDEEVLLFDCGPHCVRRLLESGTSPTRITGLFLTHLHYDHCVDYGHLVLSRWDQGGGRIPDLEVFGPEKTRQMTDALFGEAGAFDPDLTARTQHPGSHFIYQQRDGLLPRQRPAPLVRELVHGEAIDRDNWGLRVAEVKHVQPYLTSLAYRLETASHSIVFSGDTAPTERLTRLAQRADLLLHMCHFVNNVVVDGVGTDPRLIDSGSGHLDAARTARDAGVKTLVLVHLTEQIDRPGIRERVLYEAHQVFGGNIVLGQDLLDVPLEPLQPTLTIERTVA
jgi:ribonuclease BN (tRNA processing enzyme)